MPGRDREDVGVEDDVLGVEAGALGQQVVGALADRDLARDRVGLALLVERHHDHRGAVAADLARLLEERLLALLEADRVDDRLALHALEPGLDHAPLATSRSSPARARCRARTAISRRNVVIACSPSSRPSSMLTSMIWAPASICSRATSSARVVVAGQRSSRLKRAEPADVGALADVDERCDAHGRRAAQRRRTARARRGAASGVISGTARGGDARAPRRRSRGCAPASCRSSRRRC